MSTTASFSFVIAKKSRMSSRNVEDEDDLEGEERKGWGGKAGEGEGREGRGRGGKGRLGEGREGKPLRTIKSCGLPLGGLTHGLSHE